MQWIAILVGLISGWWIDESYITAGMGALLGLAVANAIRLGEMDKQMAQYLQEIASLKKAQASLELRVQQHEPFFTPDVQDVADIQNVMVVQNMAEVQYIAEVQDEVVEPDTVQVVGSLPEDVVVLSPAEDLVWTPEDHSQSIISEPVTELPTEAPKDGSQHWTNSVATHYQPGLIENGLAAMRKWLLGGNTVLRVGIVVLFLGLAFLLRYATEGMVVSTEMRYAGVAASAVCLLGLGWWLRLRNHNYALMLQGAGVAVLYLTVFAALRLNPLLEPGFAFGLMVAVTVFSAILAVSQNSLPMAAVVALGGFAAPILTSSGAGSHIALFSYFALLNAGILAIAWFKAWRLLNVIGFVGTFGIGFAWGIRSYIPEMLWSTEPFLILFFLIYLAIGLLFARRKLRDMTDVPEGENRNALLHRSVRNSDYVDGVMLFGPPLVGFGLQFAVVQHLEFAVAFSALALGIVYMGFARLLIGGRAMLLGETCLALGVIFGSLAIPLALDAGWTSAAWAVEGAGIFWLGLRQRRPLSRGFALLLQAGAAVAYFSQLHTASGSLLEGSLLGALLPGVALLFSHFQLRKAMVAQVAEWERSLSPSLAVCGLAFLYLMFPLNWLVFGVTIGWAIAGLLTLFAGLRLQSRVFLFCAFAVQLLAGILCLSSFLDTGAETSSGWSDMFSALLAGFSLIGGMLLAVRDDRVREDKTLLHSLSLVLLAGLVMINLAVLFIVSWRTVGGIWAFSGLLIVWLGLYLQQRLSFIFGLVLQVSGGGAFLLANMNGLALMMYGGATDFWVPLALSLAAFVGAWRLQHEGESPAFATLSLRGLSNILLLWGVVWWLFAAVSEVLRVASPGLQSAFLLGIAAFSSLLWTLLSLRMKWASLALLPLLLCPVAISVLIFFWHEPCHPAADLGWIAWTLVLAAHFFSLHRLSAMLPARIRSAAHILGCWLLAGLLMLELRYGLLTLSGEYNAWCWLGWAIVPVIYLVLMASPRHWPWPVSAEPRAYRFYASLPMAVLMFGWFWIANIASDGRAEPLPYLPLINPLELSLLFALTGVGVWVRSVIPELPLSTRQAKVAIELAVGASLFAFFTAFVMRTAHHWGGVAFQIAPLLASMLVQAGLSIVWTLIALSLMIGGHLRRRREIWLIGAALIAVVVAKLFFIELGNRGGLARIISFIGVGVLLLVVGYFAPLPPKQVETEPEKSGNGTEGAPL